MKLTNPIDKASRPALASYPRRLLDADLSKANLAVHAN